MLNTFLLYDSKIYYNLFTNTELQMLKSLLNNNLHPEMKQFSIEMHNYYDELFPQTNYELFPAISSKKKPRLRHLLICEGLLPNTDNDNKICDCKFDCVCSEIMQIM